MDALEQTQALIDYCADDLKMAPPAAINALASAFVTISVAIERLKPGNPVDKAIRNFEAAINAWRRENLDALPAHTHRTRRNTTRDTLNKILAAANDSGQTTAADAAILTEALAHVLDQAFAPHPRLNPRHRRNRLHAVVRDHVQTTYGRRDDQ